MTISVIAELYCSSSIRKRLFLRAGTGASCVSCPQSD